ncbi:hypothetical protein ES703_54622 [subsurface metagenome]
MVNKWIKQLIVKLYTKQPLTEEEDGYCMSIKDELAEGGSS